MATIIFLLFQFLVEYWSKWRHILKKYRTDWNYNNKCGIFENMTSFTQILNEELEKANLMAALNYRK